jgi:diacylglycerol kinase (ATP)
MPHKIQFIVNPAANHGRSQQVAAGLRSLTAGQEAVWHETERAGHAVVLARQAGEQGCDLVVACGGDGTVHEVVNGLMQVPKEKRPALGIIPLGSGNDFAHILGLPSDPVEALRSALDGQPHALDIGLACDQDGRREYFDNTLGIGFDAVVTLHTLKITAIHGFMMYFVAVLKTIILNFTPMDLRVETDQESWEMPTLMLTLGNGPREGGGFMVTPKARLDDGLLDYATIRKISRLMMFRLIPEVMKGTHGRFKPVKMGTCRKMSVACEQPFCVHCDGEIYAGFDSKVRELSLEILPSAIFFLKS